jgi:hypothetical protein
MKPFHKTLIAALIAVSISSINAADQTIMTIFNKAGINSDSNFISVYHNSTIKNINVYSKEFFDIIKKSDPISERSFTTDDYSITVLSGSSRASQKVTVDVGKNFIHSLKYLDKKYYFKNVELNDFCKKAFLKSDIIIKQQK